ncbi:MAG: hypothetical protein ACI4N3_05125 [Alphaproteobacteria bacterium]
MKKNKIIMSLILSVLLINSVNAISPVHTANAMARAHASRKRKYDYNVQVVEYPIYNATIVDKIEVKIPEANYFLILADRDGDESTIEIVICPDKYTKYLISDQLKKGSKFKYVDRSFGKNDSINFDDILEIDGVRPNNNIRNYLIYEGNIVKKFEVKTKKDNYIRFLIDKDGDKSTIENSITISKEYFRKSPISNQLKEGSHLKYKDCSFGKNVKISLDDILEIDGKEPLIHPIYEGKIVKKFEVKSKEDYVMFLIDNNGDENTIENKIILDKQDLPRFPIANQLKEGAQLKYKANEGDMLIPYVEYILEIDGVKQR